MFTPAGSGRDFSGGVTFRAPKRRRRLRTGDVTRGLDYCRASLARRRVRLVSIPVAQVGAVHVDEEVNGVLSTNVASFIFGDGDF